MVWLLPAAPISVRVIFPVYAATCGLSVVASAVTVNVTGPPGTTTPLGGATVSQVDLPASAANETGPPVVVNCTVCAAGAGGLAKFSEVGLRVRTGRGAVTTSFTLVVAAVPGGTAAAGVNVTAAVYVPTASPVGFTCTTTLAGRAPASGLRVNHGAGGAMALVKVAPVALALAVIVCAAGNAAPC